jgi:L-aspartate oxidase
MTLDIHSHKKADRYKKPSCIGVVAFHHETQKIEYFLAKETILATGGASSLFPYSTHPSTAWGSGLAIAHRAGARLLNMEHIQFHPLTLYERDRPCFPLPIGLISEGGKIYARKAQPLEVDTSTPASLLNQLYDQLLKTSSEHLWLDLTSLDHEKLKEKFPSVDIYCLNHGFNIVKDPLPVVPAAAYTCGGIVVDKTAQTTLHRLRAVGEVSCTGLFWDSKEESLSVLESLTWGLACAEDIAKQTNKFIYYFPDLREGPNLLSSSSSTCDEDWKMLKQIMWTYVGIRQDKTHLLRGCALIDQLSSLNTPLELTACSFDQIQLMTAIQTAQLIAHAVRGKNGPMAQCFLRFPAFAHK